MRTGSFVAFPLVAAAWTAAAQEPATPGADSVVCEGRRITSVDIIPRVRINVDEVRPGALRPLVKAVLRTTPNRPQALSPYVLLRAGDVCSDARREESERLLRSLRYVASARVRAEPDGDGVRLLVEATDDILPIVGLRLDGVVPEHLQLGTTSFAGSGTLLAGHWTDGGAYRDGVGVRAVDWTTLGRRTTAAMALERRPLGQLSYVELSEPYVTRFQSLAWAVSFRNETEYVALERNRPDPAAWRTEWHALNSGAVARVGIGGVQLLAGGLYTWERAAPADSGVLIGEDGLLPPPPVLTDRYPGHEGSRAGTVLGLRALSFRRAEGLESLEGAHDVARGLQLATVVGGGLSGDDRGFFGAESYVGAGHPRSFASLRTLFERRSRDAGSATRLTSARFAWYVRAGQRQTQEISIEYTGIWRDDTPVALFLDDRRTGPRGFDGANVSGSRLLVARVERRVRAGGFGRAVAIGFAGFVDGAKLWSGDSPVGTTTDPVFGAGVGLLAAIPRDSRRTIRLDAAVPASRGYGAGGVDVRLSLTAAGRAYWREPAGFMRARVAPMLRTLVGWF